MTTRNYSYKNVDMMMAAKTICQSFQTNLPDLSLVRSTWDEAYATNLSDRISAAMDDYLGLDKQGEQRAATARMKSIQQPAIDKLSFLKTQVEVDFGKDATEILNTLGYNKNWRRVQYGDQEGLIELLYAFKKGMTQGMKNRIAAKGTSPLLIETIIGYASEMEQANLNQESLKMASRALSEEAQSVLNAIYTEVVGICKIAAKYYKNDPLRKQQFTFSKVVRNMGVAPKKEVQEEIPADE